MSILITSLLDIGISSYKKEMIQNCGPIVLLLEFFCWTIADNIMKQCNILV